MLRRIVYIITLLLTVQLAVSQTVGRYEYWVDNDYTGRTTGNGSNEQENLNLSVDVSNLTDGVHFLFFRAYNSDGVPSSLKQWLFCKFDDQSAGVKLSRYEYWVDNDYAGRTTVSGDQTDQTFNVDVSGLTDGIHFLFYRAFNTAGKPSALKQWLFGKFDDQSAGVKLSRYEYWVDNDYAGRTTVSGDQTDQTFNVDVSSLTDGIHFLFYRAFNTAGKPSALKQWLFGKFDDQSAGVKLSRYEYWIDNDYAGRTTVKGNETDQTFQADLSNLSVGVHFLFYRAFNTAGKPSALKQWLFYKPADAPDDEISGYEYWIDNDYAGRTVSNTAPDDPEYLFIDVDDLKPGVHTFNYRLFTKAGLLSIPYNWVFFIPPSDMVDDTPLAGYQYTFGDITEYVEIPEEDDYEMNEFLFEIPELTKMAKVDENCAFTFKTDMDSVIMTRNTKVGFGLQFRTRAGSWSMPVTYGYEEKDTLRRVASELPLQQTVTFDKRNRGDMDVFKLVVATSKPYYLRASQSCKIMLFNAKDGSLTKTIMPDQITGSFKIALSKGTYYGIVTETVIDDANASDVISVRFMENDNFLPTPTISYVDELVTLNCENSNATIYYTLDGSDPTDQSSVYSAPFAFKHNGVIKAVAKYQGMADSYVAVIKITSYTVEKPVIGFANLLVKIATSTPGASIYYTTDGSNPLESGILYTAPFSIPENCTVKAVAKLENFNNSGIASEFIDISNVKCAPPQISFNGDTLMMSTFTDGASIRYTLDGSDPTAQSALYEGPVVLEMNCVVRAITMQTGAINSSVTEYTVDWFRLGKPKISFSAQTGMVTIVKPRTESTVYYAIDGNALTTSSPVYEAPFKLDHNTTIYAYGVCDHFLDSETDSLVVNSYKAANPVVRHVNGKIVITCATDGAVIKYTLDEKDPLVFGTVYVDSVALNEIGVVKVVATKTGYNNSDVVSFSLGKCQTPTFECVDNVLTMSTPTDGASIYYTIDGSAPDSLCTLYSNPVRLEYNQKVRAVSSLPGMVDSDPGEFTVDWFKVDSVAFGFTEGILAISCPTVGAVIYYQIGGSDPTENSTVYTAPIVLTDNREVRAYAVKKNFNDSEVGSYTPDYFTCVEPQIVFNGNSVTMSTTTESSKIYYTLNGTAPTAKSTLYDGSVLLDGLCTVKAITIRDHFNNSTVTEFELPCYYNGDAVYVNEPGSMSKAFEWCGTADIESMNVRGTIGGADFEFIRTQNQLRYLDMSGAKTDGDSLPAGAFRNTGLISVSTPSVISKVGSDLFKDCDGIAAIQWNAALNVPEDLLGGAKKPNMLLYVKSGSYVRAGLFNNVIVNGITDQLTLTDSETSDFWCPVEFTALKATYTHNYSMKTAIGECTAWETLALPFTVQTITHAVNGTIVPFGAAKDSDTPFWLDELTASGFLPAIEIKANTPYILCMPNNDHYADKYILAGDVTFSATNVQVEASTAIKPSVKGEMKLVPNYANGSSSGRYELNVYEDYQGHKQGSLFVKDLRRVKPFEACVVSGSGASMVMLRDMFNGGTTGVELPWAQSYQGIWNMNGIQMQNIGTGIQIINGKKVIIVK